MDFTSFISGANLLHNKCLSMDYDGEEEEV